MDVTQVVLLKEKMMIHNDGYERVSEVCYFCGMIDHSYIACSSTKSTHDLKMYGP